MKLSKLKPGMVIVNELNYVQIVLENPETKELCSMGYDRYNSSFSNYPEDLNNQDSDKINIICVGKIKKPVPLKYLEQFLNRKDFITFKEFVDIIWKTEDFYKMNDLRKKKIEVIKAYTKLMEAFLIKKK